MIYTILIVIGAIICIVNLGVRDRLSRFLMWYLLFGLVILMILVAGLRYDVGADFAGYTHMFLRSPRLFEGVISYSQRAHGEIGFYLVAGVIKWFGFSESWVLFFVFAALAVTINVASLRRYSNYIGYAFFLYLCFYFFGREMGQIRQGLATSILFWSVRYVIKRDVKRFILVVLVASAFHVSSLVILPLYFIGNLSFSRRLYCIVLLSGLVLSFVPWHNYILPFLPSNLPGLDYIGTVYDEPYSLFSISMLRRILPAILVLVWYRALAERSDSRFLVFRNMVIIGAFLSLLFREIGIFAERLTVPYLFAEIVVYPELFVVYKSRHWRLIWSMFILLLGISFVYNLLQARHFDFFPYKNVLF